MPIDPRSYTDFAVQMNRSEQSQLHHSFELLGADPNCGWDEIEKQYRQLVQQWHPDRNAGKSHDAATHKFIEINTAYKLLRSHYVNNRSIEHHAQHHNPDGVLQHTNTNNVRRTSRFLSTEQSGPLLGTKKHTS